MEQYRVRQFFVIKETYQLIWKPRNSGLPGGKSAGSFLMIAQIAFILFFSFNYLILMRSSCETFVVNHVIYVKV